MFLKILPARQLTKIVGAYWFIEDIPGEFSGQSIRTSPVPMAVLSINLGRPNKAEHGSYVPNVSLLGLQSAVRRWRSYPNTYFVMVMLTVTGVVRLFPHVGESTAGSLLELGAVTGDSIANSLLHPVTAALEPMRIATELDRWLIARLKSVAPIKEIDRFAAVYQSLSSGCSVATAAKAANVNRRQVHRWFHQHIGIGPKELADLERLHGSLKAVQAGIGDPVKGFSDQAHQIRSWRRRLDITPGSYGRNSESSIAARFNSVNNQTKSPFYL